jgi:hypothetical protein
MDEMNFKLFPLFFIKKNKQDLTSLINNFYNYLPQLGFSIKSYRVLTFRQYEMFQIKK